MAREAKSLKEIAMELENNPRFWYRVLEDMGVEFDNDFVSGVGKYSARQAERHPDISAQRIEAGYLKVLTRDLRLVLNYLSKEKPVNGVSIRCNYGRDDEVLERFIDYEAGFGPPPGRAEDIPWDVRFDCKSDSLSEE